MFGTDRNQLRQMYKTAWEKYQQKHPMTPLETQIAEVVREHPEYHNFVNQLEQDFLPELGEANPFLHMGMHLGLREQLATNRPDGIVDVYQQLLSRLGSPHDAEHQMIDCLAEAMWLAQQNNRIPDEVEYLKCLKNLVLKSD